MTDALFAFARVLADIEWVIVCDGSGCVASISSGCRTRHEAREAAYEQGWCVDWCGDWYCESCRVRRDAESDDADRWLALHVVEGRTQ